MSLLFRDAGRRDWTPPLPLNSERGVFSSRSVNLAQSESALQKIAIYASVRLIREVVTSIPLDFFTRIPGKQAQQVPMPKWLEDPDGAGYGLPDWMGQVAYSDAMRGNVVAEIAARDAPSGQPRQLVLQHPDEVSVHRNPDGRPEWNIAGRTVDAENVWHRRSFPIPGSIWGLSPVGAHALTIGLGIASEQFGAQFFLDGGHPTAIFQNTEKKLDAGQAATIKARIKAVLAGNREPLVLGADWDYKPIQVSPNESQFLETNNYTDTQCARIFGPGMPEILGYETGGSMTYTNVEQRALWLLTFTLDPWLVRFERMLLSLLPDGTYAKFNRGALLRTDLLTRFQAHEIALRNRFVSIDEVRDLEDKPPMIGNDMQKWQEVGLPALVTAGIVSPKWAAEQVGAPNDGMSDVAQPFLPAPPASGRTADPHQNGVPK